MIERVVAVIHLENISQIFLQPYILIFGIFFEILWGLNLTPLLIPLILSHFLKIIVYNLFRIWYSSVCEDELQMIKVYYDESI